MCEELLGYLLGALEPEEAARVEAKLEADPALRRQLEALRDRLRPLTDDDVERLDPPADLAARVCEHVDEVRREEATAAADVVEPPASQSSWYPVDAAAVMGVSLAALVLFVPVLASQRYRSETIACKQKLQNVGQALVAYSRNHHGFFPEIPAHGNTARAGIYAVKLRESGYLASDAELFCPAIGGDDATFVVPTRVVLLSISPVEAEARFHQMDGVHGYALGYTNSAGYQTRRNRHRARFAVLGDSPQEHGGGGRNHGCGQNLWFEDGHAEFLRSSRLPANDDAIYENHRGVVGAGVDEDDVVIGAASAAPLLTPVSH